MAAPAVEGVVQATLDGGVNWFDTAELYGFGESETALAGALQKAGVAPGAVIIATKWFPILRTARSIGRTIETRLAALGGYPIDLQQVHMPLSLSSVKRQMQAMAALHRQGQIRAVGVSNFPAWQMRRAHVALEEEGLVLASNQVPCSLVNRRIEENGVLQAAQELGITIIAYWPLSEGLLSGKYHDDPDLVREKKGLSRRFSYINEKGLQQTARLVEALKEIAAAHGATPAQVALNWLVSFYGETVVAIPGTTNAQRAAQNAAAMNLALSEKELARLDELSRAVISSRR
jgi:aryl-alcohol dehydrogenase-like predicted oxidoreductase